MEFTTIQNFERYEIRSDGVVRIKETKMVVAPFLMREKYAMVNLMKDGKYCCVVVNTLVRDTFSPIQNLDGEVWKVIVGFPNYVISTYGRVKNTKYNRLLLQNINQDGYARVKLTSCDKKKQYGVHRLVAEAFIPNPDNLPIPDHLDLNKINNKVSNLRWATLSQNSQNQLARGVVPYKGVSTEGVSYRATIRCDGDRIHIGNFETAEEAAHAYDIKAREIYGEHARLNFP